jgi:hypothetical protein
VRPSYEVTGDAGSAAELRLQDADDGALGSGVAGKVGMGQDVRFEHFVEAEAPVERLTQSRCGRGSIGERHGPKPENGWYTPTVARSTTPFVFRFRVWYFALRIGVANRNFPNEHHEIAMDAAPQFGLRPGAKLCRATA